MKRNTEIKEVDVERVVRLVKRLLAIGVPVGAICRRLEIMHGEIHWWWKQKRKRDQDNPTSPD